MTATVLLGLSCTLEAWQGLCDPLAVCTQAFLSICFALHKPWSWVALVPDLQILLLIRWRLLPKKYHWKYGEPRIRHHLPSSQPLTPWLSPALPIETCRNWHLHLTPHVDTDELSGTCIVYCDTYMLQCRNKRVRTADQKSETLHRAWISDPSSFGLPISWKECLPAIFHTMDGHEPLRLKEEDIRSLGWAVRFPAPSGDCKFSCDHRMKSDHRDRQKSSQFYTAQFVQSRAVLQPRRVSCRQTSLGF